LVIQRFSLSRKDTTYQYSTTCNPRDTGLVRVVLQNLAGCDSLIIRQTSLLRRDSIRILRTSCVPADTGIVTQRFTNSVGCDSIIVTQTQLIPSGIATNLQILQPVACAGATTGALRVAWTGGQSPYRVNWSNGKFDSLQISSLSAGFYVVTITDARGCPKTDSALLTEPNALKTVSKITSPQCFGFNNGQLRIDSVVGGTPPLRLTLGATGSPISRFPFSMSGISAGKLVFSVSDANGCQKNDTILVTQPPLRTITFNEPRVRLTLGDVYFMPPQFNFTPKSWEWFPKTGLRCDTCLQAVAIPARSTTYRLVARDSAGCEAIGEIALDVEKLRRIFVPTTFSPNGDGNNDRFMMSVDSEVSKIVTFQIFNRWGAKLYELDNFLPRPEEGWDGTFNGSEVESGVYIYYFTVLFRDGSVEIYKGDVTLIR
jgi:gliding motility-associated-like protein